MYRIRNITFKDHPILGNLQLNFCDKDGNAVDTVIIAGINGVGKSNVLEALYKLASHKMDYEANVEYLIDGSIKKVSYVWGYGIGQNKYIHFIDDDNNTPVPTGSTFEKTQYPFMGIFSDAKIYDNTALIRNISSSDYDTAKTSQRSESDITTIIKQMIIDIQSSDNDIAADIQRKNPDKTRNELNIAQHEKIHRFKNAFPLMFDDLRYDRIDTVNNHKEVIFTKYGRDITIDSLSSGEKQIIYRGCFLLKDKEALKGAFVFIDEPEISMHPEWQKKILDYYKAIFTNESGVQTSQIFVVTHSPFIIHNEYRRDDKVIVLKRDKNGKIEVMNKPEYAKCDSIELVEDAFSITPYSIEKPTVFLEGKTDVEYFRTVVSIFGLNSPFDFQCGGGEDQICKLYNSLKLRQPTVKIVCLLDCDMKTKLGHVEKAPLDKALFATIKRFDNPWDFDKGIENALYLQSFDLEPFKHSRNNSDHMGGAVIKIEVDKTALCKAICELDNVERQKSILKNIKDVVEDLIAYYEGEDPCKLQSLSV